MQQAFGERGSTILRPLGRNAVHDDKNEIVSLRKQPIKTNLALAPIGILRDESLAVGIDTKVTGSIEPGPECDRDGHDNNRGGCATTSADDAFDERHRAFGCESYGGL